MSALKTLNAHRDVLALKKALPSLENFRLAHRALKLLFKLRGLIGARFGYLGGFHLAVLLARICLPLPPSASVAEIVRVFFHTYSRWDWEHDMVTVPIPGLGVTYHRNLGREPMCILSIEKPAVNITINATAHSLQVMKTVFTAVDHLLENGASWKDACLGQGGKIPFRQFLIDHKAFVKIEVNYWGTSCMNGRALVGWLESRFVNVSHLSSFVSDSHNLIMQLLVQLQTNTPSLHVRFWPSRFSGGNAVDGQNLSGFYLFGLTSISPIPTSDAEKRIARKENAQTMSTLTTTLRAFESDVQQNSRYYDPSDTFISVTNIGYSQLPLDLILDPHVWSDNGFDDEEDSDDDDDDDIESSEPDLKSFDPTTRSSASLQKKLRTKAKVTPHLQASKL